MARILTVAVGLLALTLILSSVFSSLFDDESEVPPTVPESAPASSDASEQWSEASGRRLLSVRVSNSSSAFVAGPSEPVIEALVAEAESEFAGVLESMDLSAQRQKTLMDSLIEARIGMASLYDSARIPPGVTDWEYLLDSVAGELSDPELAELEQALKSEARADVRNHFGPQLELQSAGLTADSKTLILDTLANELLLTPYSRDGQEQGAVGHLIRQHKALAATEAALATAMNQQQREQANDFFTAQADALEKVLELFGYTNSATLGNQ